jgi:DNA-binding transcriptional ArsR family regulator
VVDTAATASLLGDPTRVRILDALTSGPMRTAELAAATGMTPAALSRHLNLLRKAEVVARMDVAGDGRGRAYELRPAALDAFAGWLRSTSWAGELAAVSAQPQTRELLTRMGGFLDAFAASDTAFFERHLRSDAVLVFPSMSHPVTKQGCIESAAGSGYHRHHRHRRGGHRRRRHRPPHLHHRDHHRGRPLAARASAVDPSSTDRRERNL